MSDNQTSGGGFGKDPLTTCHGDSLVDQSFQSLKSKEIRDSISPTQDVKFHSLSLNQPNSTGWNVQTSSEVSPDGRAYRNESLATTDGVEKINGGLAEFKGRNEQKSSGSHQGDDKNFVKKASESSNTHLQEKVVYGDENSGRTEMKMSSTTTSSSSSKVVSSSTTSTNPDDVKYLTDNLRYQQERQQYEQQREQLQREQQAEYMEKLNTSHLKTSQNIETTQKQEHTKRITELDKSSPEYQQHVEYLMSQPGEIVSNTVEYPKPNVKLITTVKRLPDGTIVRNKRYETEETTQQPTIEHINRRSSNNNINNTTTKQTERRRDSNFSERTQNDVVDSGNIATRMNAQQYNNDDIQEASYSSIKKSNSRYSSERTSETIHENKTSDFSTHGFPSVRTDRTTQEYPKIHPTVDSGLSRNDRNEKNQNIDFSTHGFPSVRSTAKVLDDEITHSYNAETQKSMKYSTNAEHITEREYHTQINDGEQQPQQQPSPSITYRVDSPRQTKEYSTNGFPSVRTLPSQQKTPIKTMPDYSTHGFPSARDGATTTTTTPTTPTAKQPITQTIPIKLQQSPSAAATTKPTTTTPTTATTTTTATKKNINTNDNSSTKLLQKEKEVDAAHRAFAASLRSASPIDTPRRDSYTDHPQRVTPRSSVSSTRTYRRDMREGSHDSNTPSETSRISSNTVTRSTPTKNIGKNVLVKQTIIKTRTNESSGSTERLTTKSPSPTKTLTNRKPSTSTPSSTTTTTTTTGTQ